MFVPIQQSVSPTRAAAARAVPTPESVIGWKPCTDYKMATYEQIADYYRKLDRASDRMRLFDIGKSSEGRDLLLAVISSEQNLKPANLERYKDIARRLALAKDLTPGEAQRLAEQGKTIAWVDFGIHATETAPTQEAPDFAYQLVSGETKELREIRENVITLVVPNLNPDGGTQVTEWYREHKEKPWELRLPELYQKYAGHDNNRDWYMFNLPESRAIADQLYREWFPQIVHNQHQSGPYPSRIFVPPFEDPVNPNIPPEVTRGVNLVGDAMTRRLTSEGKPGAVSRISFDMWWNGGMRSAPYYHNMIGILTETSHNSPTPAFNDPAKFPATFENGESTKIPSVSYPDPYQGGWWHMSQSCEYVSSTSLAMLDLANEKRTEWLEGIYRMGRAAIGAGADETYVIPADQADVPTAVKLVNTLRRGGVEIEQATAAFEAGGRTYPAGSFLVRGAQAFRPYLADLLNPQVYPERRACPTCPLDEPYDITGYTLSLQMGVDVDKFGERVAAPTKAVSWAQPPAGTVSAGPAAAYALDSRVNDTFTAVAKVLAAGDQVRRTTGTVTTDQGSWPAGTFLVTATPESRSRLEQLASKLGLRVGTVTEIPATAKPVSAPRVGLYQAWGSGFYDEGWTRYIFDTFEIPYARLQDAAIRAGNLREKYDVIVLPDATYRSMRDGNAAGSMPAEYTGGMSPQGVANLEAFVKAGGTLVAMDSATQLPIQAFGLPVKDVTAGVSEEKLYIPGSLLRVNVDNTTPLGYGMPERSFAFFSQSPAFELQGDGAATTARYPSQDLLASGWILGEEILANTTAVADVAYGDGQVALLGFRTQHRAQAHGTYKLLFNALYLGSAG
ncbi:M14 family metallopeptidase [Actinopolymorpha alba]|uniref:M14 family metallopeptidase n=1 Tax=Actinopolymorpha alba TaxID=533267 RepID=UPI00058E84E8|nr:M14 metallopeptidase family protein [Actinopolymorpha alba]